jgi:hypothetical protein
MTDDISKSVTKYLRNPILKTTHQIVHIIPSSQVQYIKTSPRAAHRNWDPGDALAKDGLTRDPATLRHGSTMPQSATEKQKKLQVSNKSKI